jgi:hypothetical protein
MSKDSQLLMTGVMLAVFFEWILKGKATAAGTLAAQGD